MWIDATSPLAQWVYLGILSLAAVIGCVAVATADSLEFGLLAASVTLALLAHLWRVLAERRVLSGATTEWVEAVQTGDPSAYHPEVKTAERGRVESWDDETGWGVLSADLPNGGVFAHFSVVEGEGYRSLTPGDPVAFEYVDAGGGPGSQDGCSYVAERVVPLEPSPKDCGSEREGPA